MTSIRVGSNGTKFMRSVLFEVGPTDPLTYVVVVAGFTAATLWACAVPSRRAVSIAPVRAIGLD
ncbi:MAG TPA: hypothetical protein DEQ98_14330 [Acidobacteria bacterium]|nr:hypothetical protein [Acidobacteriota bacterium]